MENIKKFSTRRIEYISIGQFNKHLNYVSKYYHINLRKKSACEPFSQNAWIDDKLIQISLTYRKGTKACTYIAFKDNRETMQKTTGFNAYKTMSKYYKIPHFDDRRILGMSASAFLYKNSAFEGRRIRAYGYDLNSAYSYAMIQPIPDTSVPYKSKKIGPNEIGFIELPKNNGDPSLQLVAKFSGYSDYVFPLMESPFKKFVEVWNKKKINASTKEQKAKAKGMLNYSIGFLQRINPFIRACIITRCNNLIKSLIDENTVYCNTDSIVSTVPRNDLKLGYEIGEWKLEHKGLFAFIGFNYQWNFDAPAYRGKSKKWFKEKWDILKDELPIEGNLYSFDPEKLKLVKVIYNHGN